LSEIIYLTKEDILTANKIAVEEFGDGLQGFDDSCVEKRVVEPQTKYFGEEQYPGIFKKASLYWYKITISHCFLDGNKRTGLIATMLFLELNGYEIKADKKELYLYCLLIANHKTRPTLDEVEEWLKKNTALKK